ncbi:hypothetical protein FRC18_004368 [Serendipita sp. 400]|nr:hypothetical protein FRC18_004368 [Serendipita sp. 400]
MRTTFVAAIFVSLAFLVSAAPLPGTNNPTEVVSVGTTSSSSLAAPAVVAAIQPHHSSAQEHSHLNETGEEKTKAVKLQRRTGEGQAHHEYYNDKQKAKHAEAKTLIQSAKDSQSMADGALRQHQRAITDAHNSLQASVAAHANDDHDLAKKHMKDHDASMKGANELATLAGKEAKKSADKFKKADGIIQDHNLEKNHPDFRRY